MVISIQADKISEGSSTIPEMGVKASALKYEAPNSKAEGEDIVSSVAKWSCSVKIGYNVANYTKQKGREKH